MNQIVFWKIIIQWKYTFLDSTLFGGEKHIVLWKNNSESCNAFYCVLPSRNNYYILLFFIKCYFYVPRLYSKRWSNPKPLTSKKKSRLKPLNSVISGGGKIRPRRPSIITSNTQRAVPNLLTLTVRLNYRDLGNLYKNYWWT